MPEPMLKILEELEKLPQEQALYVKHKKLPVYLLPELRDKGFSYQTRAVSDEHQGTQLDMIIYSSRISNEHPGEA